MGEGDYWSFLSYQNLEKCGITSYSTASNSNNDFNVIKSDRTCNYCGKIFTRPAELERHIRVHTGERPYKCPHCDYSGRQQIHLKSHLVTRHSNIVNYDIMPGLN